MRRCNGKVESSWEIKRQRWREKIGGSVIVSVDQRRIQDFRLAGVGV